MLEKKSSTLVTKKTRKSFDKEGTFPFLVIVKKSEIINKYFDNI